MARCVTAIRDDLRPHGQRESSNDSPCRDKSGEATCKPSCASHSAASNFPDLPITCSNTGTRKAHHKTSRSASVILGCSGRDRTMMECVSDGMPSRARAFNCSRVPATAAGAKAAASTLQPWGTHAPGGWSARFHETRERAPLCGARDGRGTQTGLSVRFEIIRRSQLDRQFRRPLFSADFH